jgi:pimeloyl-ACP methyl ester carboxylesterase
MVCVHGFTDTWRTWEPVLPALERHREVLAPTLPGHAGGPRIEGPLHDGLLADAVERAMDAAGFATAHLVGNSLGGHVALQVAARGRARTVVALAPAGGWAPGDPAAGALLDRQAAARDGVRAAAPHAPALLATAEGRRQAFESVVSDPEGIPVELLAHIMVGAAACTEALPMIEHARHAGWALDVSLVECPVRFVWGTADRQLPWPAAAERFRLGLPWADWVVLDGVGHAPQLEAPLETAELILEFTAR